MADEKLIEIAAKGAVKSWGYKWDCFCEDRKEHCDCGSAVPETSEYGDEWSKEDARYLMKAGLQALSEEGYELRKKDNN